MCTKSSYRVVKKSPFFRGLGVNRALRLLGRYRRHLGRSRWGFREINLAGRRRHLGSCSRSRYPWRRRHFGHRVAAFAALLARHRVLCAAFWTFGFRDKAALWADRQRVFHRSTFRAGFQYFFCSWGSKAHFTVLLTTSLYGLFI